MKAIRIHQHGASDVLQIEDLPEPSPKDFEVKIRLKATSLNHMDIWVRQGMPGIAPLPLTLGCDGSGIIEDIGAEVSRFKKGDRVFLFPLTSCGLCKFCLSGKVNYCREFKIFGEHQNGTHCDFICVDQSNVMKLADNISFAEGASFPLVFMTAWHMLVANGQIQPGDDVLIMAGASGVGSAAIQIAKLFGAKVIATVGGKEKRDLALKLGADEVIDHYAESISSRVKEITKKKGVEVVFEHVGLKVWEECLKSLAWGGKLITCGATSGPNISLDLRHLFIKQQRIIGSTMGTKEEVLKIHQFLAEGRLKATVDKIFPYQDVKLAHQHLEQSKNFGKVVLSWG